jgi:outer membrane protein, heavy metal efflux system
MIIVPTSRSSLEMRKIPVCGPKLRILVMAVSCATALPTIPLRAQDSARILVGPTSATLTLGEARDAARRVSPELDAAREAVTAAAARERQAHAVPNPTLSYQREQTSGNGETNSQNIASVDQALEFGGTRGARVAAARLRREIAEARLAAAEAQLDFDVTRVYANAAAADRKVELAERAANAFA